MSVRDTFADNVRAYRTHAGLTQEELAEKCGLHRTYIGRIEQKRENPTLGSADKIARALGIDFALFFVDTRDIERSDESGRLLTDYQSGDCALCTWTKDGLHLDPLDSDDPDRTLRVLSILAEDNPENLAEAYAEVRRSLILKESDANTDWLSDQFDN